MDWYVSCEGNVAGPLSAEEVRQGIADGDIERGMHVRDEQGTWTPVEASPFANLLPPLAANLTTADEPRPPIIGEVTMPQKKADGSPTQAAVGCLVLLAVAFMVLKLSCSDDEGASDPVRSTAESLRAPPEKAVQDRAEPVIRTGQRTVSSSELGEAWPFTAERVTLRCGGLAGTTSAGQLLWDLGVEADGKMYALNGLAKEKAPELGWIPEIEPILKERRAGGKVSLTETIAAAVKTCESQPWYVGGTLHKRGALDWQQATAPDKLATCADLVASLWQKKALKPAIANGIDEIDDLKPRAAELAIALDKAFEPDPDAETNRKKFTNQKVSETAVILATMMGWVQ